MDDELTVLQREWRASVTKSIEDTAKKLDSTSLAMAQKLDLVLVQITSMRTEYAQLAHLNEVAKRVADLEKDRAKFIGGILILNFFAGVAVLVILKMWGP
jgi:hypothetical protein